MNAAVKSAEPAEKQHEAPARAGAYALFGGRLASGQIRLRPTVPF